MFYYMIAAAVVFGIAMAGMAIGVIVSNRRLKGSCGGLNNETDGEGRTVCGLCSNPAPECRGEQDAESRQREAAV